MKDGANNTTVKLNLGSGHGALDLDGWKNLDGRYGDEIYPLHYPDGSVDEIRAAHVLEHYGHRQTRDVLLDWVRALKPGGWLKIAVPDFRWIAETYLGKKSTPPEGQPLQSYLMGGQIDERDFHKTIFDRASLAEALKHIGLTDIQEWKSEIADCASLPVSLNLMGMKPIALPNPLPIQIQAHNYSIPPGMPDDPRWLGFISTVEPLNVYSQFGEDGIIKAIFDVIKTENEWCFEAGAGDGLFFSNTRLLFEQGWHGLLVEKDRALWERLRQQYQSNDKVITVGSALSSTLRDAGLDGLLARWKMPIDLDLLSLDVDGQEYYLINALSVYHPRVLIVEYDPDADAMFIPERDKPGQAGQLAMRYVVEARGYDVICRTQCNLICVRRDEAEKLRNWPVQAREAEPQRQFIQGQWREVGTAPGQVMPETVKVPPVALATSTPRYGSLHAADVMWSVAGALRALPMRGGSAWWEQGLTNQIEKALEIRIGENGVVGTEGELIEFIATMDFDTYCKPSDGVELLKLLYENPHLDCIVATQIRRGMFEEILAQTDGATNLTHPYIPITSGHFGLSIFRRRVFEQMPAPWFLNVPNDEGRWRDGNTDADIYFWNRFCDRGLKAAMATKVVVGHGDEVIAHPVMDNGKVIKKYMSVYKWMENREIPPLLPS